MLRRLLVATALAAILGTAIGVSPLAHASTAVAARGPYLGSLVAAPASTTATATAPVTLMLQTLHHGRVSVNVTSSTRLYRRYGSPSSLAEFAAGDVLQVWGTPAGAGTLTATSIRDLSLQVAYTTFYGLVTAVTPASGTTPASVTVTVERRHARAPFLRASSQVLPVGATTTVVSGTQTMTGTTSLLSTGQHVYVLGVYSRTNAKFISVFRIRILPH